MSRLIRPTPPSRILSFVFPFIIGLLAITLTACGGSSSSKTAVVPPVVTVAVGPATANLGINATKTFTATVTGSTNTSVTWSVSEAGGGTIDSTGKYTAAAKAGTYHVVATSQASATASAAATVIVTAPSPTFTSTAPTAAVEAGAYSYALTATDPAGTSVTFALTSGPTGATISGGNVSWTPSPAQSRVSNSFTVTATTGAGGTGQQSWAVTPNGTIHGSWIDTYWSAQGHTLSKYDDLSNGNYSFSAVVLNADGTTATSTGTGNSDGTFTIDNVPAGYYWLNMSNGYHNESYWTNSTTFDRGTDYTGRLNNSDCSATTLNLSLSGLDSNNSYYLFGTVPNQYSNSNGWYGYEYGYGSTYTGTMQMCGAIDPTLGDATYIVQTEYMRLSDSFNGEAFVAGPALALPSLAVADGGTVQVTGNLTNNPQSVDVKFRGADWTASFVNVAPSPVTLSQTEAMEYVQPFVSDRVASQASYWFSDSPPVNDPSRNYNQSVTNLWDAYGYPQSWNIDAGTIEYNNPYPSSWLPVYAGMAYAYSQDTESGLYNAYLTTTPTANGSAPLMSPVQNPMIDGANLFTPGASSNASAVTLSWTAPTGLPAYGYEIYYYNNDGYSCGYYTSGNVYTASTTVTLPPGLLVPGCNYTFEIGAMADSRAKIGSTPYRGGYPQAYANVISATVLITSDPGTPDVVRGRAAVARTAQKNVIHTKNGDFLVTRRGNKPLNAKARMTARFNQRPSSQTSKAKAGSTVN